MFQYSKVQDEQEFNKVWNQSNQSFLMSWWWGEIKRKTFLPYRVIIGTTPYTLFLRKFPLLNKYFGYIPRPVITKDHLPEHLQKLVELSKELQITHLIIEPQISDRDYLEIFSKYQFISNEPTIQPGQTNIINLDENIDAIWMRMRSSTRKKIRKAIKNGCIVRCTGSNMTKEDIDNAINEFYPIMENIYSRTDYTMWGKDYFREICYKAIPQNLAKIYFVISQNQVVGSILYLYDRETTYEMYGGVNKEGMAMLANYLLKWKAIEDSKKNGYKRYDQWGVSRKIDGEYLHNDPLHNISLFKEGFGGEYVQYLPQQIYVRESIYYIIYKIGTKLSKLKSQILKRLRKI